MTDIARELFITAIKTLTAQRGLMPITRPDPTTLAECAKGALACEEAFNRTKKRLETPIAERDTGPTAPLPGFDAAPDNGAAHEGGGVLGAPQDAKGPY